MAIFNIVTPSHFLIATNQSGWCGYFNHWFRRSSDPYRESSTLHRYLITRVVQTIINQDVSLFSGTIRSNIDPFDEHDDHECWDVLKRCHLVAGPDGPGPIWSLETPISQTGSLSAGERQLVALARAVLRGSQVVVMDEATSAIDLHLDDMVHPSLVVSHTVRLYRLDLSCQGPTNYPRRACRFSCNHDCAPPPHDY